MKFILAGCFGILALVFGGCATYIPPGGKADLRAFTTPSIQEGFDLKPASGFPASIAALRVQAPGYRNEFLDQNGGPYGSGRYTIVMTREVEDQSQFDRIATLPKVSGLVALNRLLLPPNLESDHEIRQAASRVQADLVFVYTFDTAFFDHDAAKPLSVITLGLSPTRKISAVTTASALLMDTRTGYIYSAYEVTEREATHATSWGSRDTADEVRQTAEKRAFAKLVDEVAASWPKLLARYEPPVGTATAVAAATGVP